MPTIQIHFDTEIRTFTASDENNNKVNFQSIPDGIERPLSEAVSVGVRPMQGLIMSLGACSGIDIVSILEKQRQVFERFDMKIIAEREEGKIPALWIRAHVEFIFTGPDLEPDKLARAAALSIDKYCSVAEILRRSGCVITYTVNHNS